MQRRKLLMLMLLMLLARPAEDPAPPPEEIASHVPALPVVTLDDAERELLASHEAGHAVVAYVYRSEIEITSVTIVPEPGYLGSVPYTLKRWRSIKPRSLRLKEMAVYLGGRAGEFHTHGEPFTTASLDIKNATDIAEDMVKKIGMSDRVGPRLLNDVSGGEASQRAADQEVGALLFEALKMAKAAIRREHVGFHALRATLLEKGTVTGAEATEIIASGIARCAPVSERPERTQLDPPE